MDGDFTVYDTLDRVAVGDIRTRLRDILGAFLFRGEDIDKKVKVLSGGERARLAMARMMLEPRNLLVLDEPTNHMDMRSKDILKNAIMKYDGTYYALPREVKPKVWFYRADIFEECGIDVRQVKTIDEFIAAGETIREKYPNACMENYNVPTTSYDFMMMLSGTGAGFCDENGNYNLASNEDVKLTFERMKKLNDSGVMSSAAEWSADWTPAFDNGEIVSQLIGGWFKTDFKNFNLESQKGKWAMAPWPEEIREGSDAGGAIWVIPAAARNKELAAEVMTKMCFDEDAAKIIFDVTGVLPALKSAADDAYYNGGNEYYACSLGEVNSEAMEYLKIFPYNPASSQEQKIILQYLDEYLQDNMTLDEALKAAQDDMINQIGNPFE